MHLGTRLNAAVPQVQGRGLQIEWVRWEGKMGEDSGGREKGYE